MIRRGPLSVLNTIVILISVLIFLSSCDLLTTRDSEDPDAPPSNYISPTTPDILFRNLSESLKDKVVENYMACLVDNSALNRDYVFIPAAGSVAQFGVLADWDRSAESQYFNNLKSTVTANQPIILQLFNEVNNTFGDSAIYQFDYSLTVPLESESSVYQGNAKFKIIVDSQNRWVIAEWEDTKKESFPSWSELKGRYY